MIIPCRPLMSSMKVIYLHLCNQVFDIKSYNAISINVINPSNNCQLSETLTDFKFKVIYFK